MSKHKPKHNHWNYVECECSRYPIDPYADDIDILREIHEQHMRLIGDVRDLLQSLEAEQTLKEGFRGMGHNILTESAGRKHMYMHRLREIVGD